MKSIRELYGLYLKCSSVTTDSRGDNTNSMFFSLKGENFDGNVFAKKALENGAEYAIIDDKNYYLDERTIVVKDVLRTLQYLATYHRNQIKIPVIAITGTNGKTTTKELVSRVLSYGFKIHATEGNLNNHIGVPITLLGIKQDTDVAIIEMGANHKGEISVLCEIAQPTHGIITNIGRAHLEGFGSYEGVVSTKKELYDYLGRGHGKVFLNSDNKTLRTICSCETFEYGRDINADIIGKIVDNDPYVEIEWKHRNNESYSRLKSSLTGSYNFENILCAVCVGSYYGIDKHNINKAIETYKPTNNRSQIIKKDSNTIILDAYNANPTSMFEALKSFHEIDTSKEKLVILGDMLELGNQTEHEHRSIIKLLESYDLSGYVIGRYFSAYNKSREIISFPETGKFIKFLDTHRFSNKYILVKGSRGNRLEEIVDFI